MREAAALVRRWTMASLDVSGEIIRGLRAAALLRHLHGLLT